MSIFSICISNPEEVDQDNYIEYFDLEEDLLCFINAKKNQGDKVHFFKVETLFDLIFNLYIDDVLLVKDRDLKYYYDDLKSRFGENLISNEFPNEVFDQDFMDRVEEKKYEFIKELEQEMGEDEGNKNDNFREDPEISAAEDEMRKWDQEDPSWRIANDFG